MIGKRFTVKDCLYECFLEKRIFDSKDEKEYDSSLKSQQDLCDLLNQLNEDVEEYNLDAMSYQTLYKQQLEKNKRLIEENEQLKDALKEVKEIGDYQEKRIKKLQEEVANLRIGLIDSIKEANEIQCTCNPCIVEECVKRRIFE